MLLSRRLFETTVKVTKEDKKDGTLGIRSIWENIHSGQVFTVCFKKQDKPKSKRKLQEEIDAFESRDGRYDCVDMDITKTDKESGIRPVNILTIKWLIFNGVKYIVE